MNKVRYNTKWNRENKEKRKSIQQRYYQKHRQEYIKAQKNTDGNLKLKPSKHMEKNVRVVEKNTLNFWQLITSMVEVARKEERIGQYKHTNFIYGLERETTLKDTKFCVITATWQNLILAVALLTNDFVLIKVRIGN